MRVAGYQMCVNDGDISENHQKIINAIEYAGVNNADILLTPEGSLSGYHNRFNQEEVEEALQDVCSKAKSLNIGLALGTCYYEESRRCYNQIRFYEKDGRYLGFHAKTLLCSNSMDEPYTGEITYYSTKGAEVFCFQGVMIGGLICNDLWANPGCTPLPDPHLTHVLANKGAKIIFHAVNGGRGDQASIDLNRAFHESNQRLRAMADHLYIVTVDNAFPLTKDNSCSSGVISPEGKVICKLPTRGEGIYIQDIPA
jgi:predicted amidohydrolase